MKKRDKPHGMPEIEFAINELIKEIPRYEPIITESLLESMYEVKVEDKVALLKSIQYLGDKSEAWAKQFRTLHGLVSKHVATVRRVK